MSIMVLGNGMVGSIAAGMLRERGEKVVIYDIVPPPHWLKTLVDLKDIDFVRGDILDFPDLLRTIQKHDVTRIIHTAGMLTAGVRERPYAGVKINILGTVNVLEAARIATVERVVFCSSGTIYSGLDAMEVDVLSEDVPMVLHRNYPRSIYACTKISSEILGLNYSELFNFEFVALRFSGVIGPWGGAPSGIPGRLLKLLVENPLENKPAIISDRNLIWKGKHEFLYSRDAAQSTVVACLASQPNNRVYNIGMGRGYELMEIVNIARELFPAAEIGIEGEIAGGFGGYPYKIEAPFSIEKARQELGYHPQFDMKNAMQDYSQWFKMFKASLN